MAEMTNRRERKWHIDFGPVHGKKDEEHVVPVQPAVKFLCEKMMVAATADGAVEIVSICIGDKEQKLPEMLKMEGSPGRTFDAAEIAQFDVAGPRDHIKIKIKFLADASWECTVFGKCVFE